MLCVGGRNGGGGMEKLGTIGNWQLMVCSGGINGLKPFRVSQEL